MVATILASVAQFELERSGERRKESAAYLRKSGLWGGGNFTYGYRPEARSGPEGKRWALVPDPETSQIVSLTAEKIISGSSAAAVCRYLKSAGVPTPNGGSEWRPQSLLVILRSPALTGHVMHQGEPVRDDDGLPVMLDPILSDKTFSSLH